MKNSIFIILSLLFFSCNKKTNNLAEIEINKVQNFGDIKDSIFDTNKDGINELVAYKHRGGSGPDYKIIYFLNKEGLIRKEATEELNEEEFKTLDDY